MTTHCMVTIDILVVFFLNVITFYKCNNCSKILPNVKDVTCSKKSMFGNCSSMVSLLPVHLIS